jgi:hypothetical protein
MSGIIAQNILDNSGLIKAQAGGGAWNFISKQTASSSNDISFTSGIDSTYKEYCFTWNNLHASTDSAGLQFNLSTDGGSSYNVTKTSTSFRAFQNESGSSTSVSYFATNDLAQGTGFQPLGDTNQSNDNDHSQCGFLYLFNPSGTVHVKHFIATNINIHAGDYIINDFIGGYGNTTSAVDAIQFHYHIGTMDVGDICLYGITT